MELYFTPEGVLWKRVTDHDKMLEEKRRRQMTKDQKWEENLKKDLAEKSGELGKKKNLELERRKHFSHCLGLMWQQPFLSFVEVFLSKHPQKIAIFQR